MTVLVACASRHGATRGIAERIALRLAAAGLATEVRSVNEVRDLGPYDAFVIGGAAYMFHWLKEAAGFVRRNRVLLSKHPVWLFSSGPLGTDLIDAKGNDVLATTEPKEFAELRGLVQPRDVRVFFGAWDATAKPIGLGERFVRLMPAARSTMPTGDFRDWPAIDAWADSIASQLEVSEAVSAPAAQEVLA